MLKWNDQKLKKKTKLMGVITMPKNQLWANWVTKQQRRALDKFTLFYLVELLRADDS